MDLRKLVEEIVYLIVTGIMPLLVAYAVLFLKTKIKEQQAMIENEQINKYITAVTDAVGMAVMTVSQTYVDELKRLGKFDAEAQAVAKKMALAEAKALITEEAKNAVIALYGDFESYLNEAIESLVRENKRLY